MRLFLSNAGEQILPGTGRGTSRTLVEEDQILPKHAWGGGPPAQPGVEGQRGGRDRFGRGVSVGKYVAGRNTENGEAVRDERCFTFDVAIWSVPAIMRLTIDFDS